MQAGRWVCALASLALAVGSWWALSEGGKTLSAEEAVAGAPAHPYYWADLAERWASEGRVEEARVAFARALERSRDVPQIWLRCANFHFALNEPEAALRLGARVIRLVPDYDEVLFSYFERFGLGPERVLAELGEEARPAQAYFRYLLGADDLGSAARVWTHLVGRQWATLPLAVAYLDGLGRRREWGKAGMVWAAWLGESRRGDYPERNRVFNGSFERAPSGAVLDWRITPVGGVAATVEPAQGRSGSGALRVEFQGEANLSYAHVTQTVPVLPGQYRLWFWEKAEGLTTDEGPRVEVMDAEQPGRFAVSSEPVLGTHGWRKVGLALAVPAGTRVLAVRVTRRPSVRFDSKIGGTLWLDEVVLQGAGTSARRGSYVIQKSAVSPSFSLIYERSDRRIL